MFILSIYVIFTLGMSICFFFYPSNNGKLCMERADLAAFAHGEYFALGKKIGQFGFSAVKKKKKR